VLSAAAIVLWATTAFAQAKPDFSGKWTREMPAAAAGGGGGAAGGGGGARGAGGGGGGRGGAGGGGGFNCGMTCDITVTGTTLKLSRAGQGEGAAPIVWTCTTDGKDCSNEQPGRGGAAPTAVVSKATWAGSKLVITTERAGQDGTKVTSTQTLAIEGGKLTVSSTNSMMPDAAPTVATYTKG
jgi:hypothetical protein